METKQDIGLVILSSGMVFGSWSAWSSSLFTVDTFVDSESKYKSAKLAMDLGLGTAVLTALGIHYVYGDKGTAASIGAVLTGLALYGAYYWKLKCNPKLDSVFNGKNKKLSTEWNPLSQQEIDGIRNLIGNNGISFNAEP